jgi:tripartite-type tricarboxylate transporter receptor subunit TctC
MKSLPYDPMRDFKYITKMVVGTPILVTSGATKQQSLRDLMEAAKTAELTYGSFGPGSFPEVYLEGLAKQAGVKFKEINYRGPPEIQHDLLNSQITMSMDAPILIGRFAAEGKMKPMAVIGFKRSRVMPEVPTFAEAGRARF